MKYLLSIIFLALIVTGCKKSNNSPEADEKKYDVTFKIADFSQTIKGFASSDTKRTMAVGDTLSNYADHFYYAIFKADGTFLRTVNQVSTDANFGKISDQLPTGNYDVFFAASKGDLTIFLYNQTYSSASFYSPLPPNWNDVFTKSFNLSVGAYPLVQDVKLERAIGALDVVLMDVLPASVSKVSLSIDKEKTSMGVKPSTTLGTTAPITRDFVLTAADAGVMNKKFSMLVGNTLSDINVTIQAFDSAGKKLAEKVVQTRIYKNQRTVLSGLLFGPTSSEFNVTVNPTWNTPGSVINF